MADVQVPAVGAGATSVAVSTGAAPTLPPVAGPHPESASPPDSGQVKAAVADANQSLAENGTQLTFVFDDQVHDMIVKIVDTQTHQVVQQIPSEAMLAAARALSGTPTNGALVNTKA